MTSNVARILLLAGAVIAASGCSKPAETNSTTNTTAASDDGNAVAASNADPTASAESAAPSAISSKASIVTVDASGAMQSIRKGTNGWTCMPDSPATPGPDPMCFDANAGKWVEAWLGHKPPPPNAVGLMYMLEGGTDASNTDPYATKPTADNDWVKTGPHIMVVGSKDILAGHPSGGSPDTKVPYVMWAATPYAHLMVPVNDGT